MNCRRYLRHILKSVEEPLVLAMDEVERLFACEFGTDFFGMLRSWHNERKRTRTPLARLDLVLVTSTEPYLFIQDANQSPFNVGLVLELEDFPPEAVARLNGLHGSPFDAAGEKELYDRLGGHPYLVRKALYLVADGQIQAEELLAKASEERGPFGDHLRYYLLRLHDNEELIEGLRRVLSDRECADEKLFWRLRGAGLVRRLENGEVDLRCKLYRAFFEQHLS